MSNARLRVAILNDAFGRHPMGGPSVRAHHLVRALAKHTGIDFALFYTDEPHPDYATYPEHLKPLGEFRPQDFNVYYVGCGVRLAQKLNNMGITPILGSNLVPNSAPLHALPFLDDAGRVRQAGLVAMEQQLVRTLQGRFWLAQSRFQEREYRRLGLPWDVPVYWAPNPIDTKMFAPPKERGDYICGVGKPGWAKAPQFFKAIARRFPDEKFLYFSDEPMPDLGENVEHQGGTNKEMPKLLSQCRIFISTSTTENSPCGVLEAMSMGLPVVAFRTSGLPEIIEDGKTGMLVDLANLDHMRVEVKRLLRDRGLREELGKAAREFVVKNFSCEVVAPLFVQLFQHYLEVR